MGKADSSKTKQKRREQQQQEEQQPENQQQYDQQDYEDQEQQFAQQDQVEDSEMLINSLNRQIEQAPEPGEKLTWAALKNLALQQHEINQKMNEEIQAIQQKYQKIKRPLASKIADVTAGIPVEKDLYKVQETQKINPNKDKPKPLQNFWAHVIFKSPLSGITDPAFDNQILSACMKVNSQIKDYQKQHIIFTMYFNGKKNQFFDHEQISIEMYVEGQGEDRKFIKKQRPQKLQCKKQPSGQSLFNVLFANDFIEVSQATNQSKFEVFMSILWDFHYTFTNSLKVYFQNQVDEYSEDQQGQEQGQRQGQGGQNEDEDQDEDEEQEQEQEDQDSDVGKPTKKANIEKPQCKQQ